MHRIHAALLAVSLAVSLALPAIATEKPIWRGQSGTTELVWTTADLQAYDRSKPGIPLFSVVSTALEPYRGETEGQLDGSFAPLSWVGPLLSVETSETYYRPLMAHPSGLAQMFAVDLHRGGQRAVLTDWFAAPDIHRALLGDSLVQRALRDQGLKPAANLEGLIKQLVGFSGDCRFAFAPDLLQRFAFHHVKGNQVAVRFGLSHGCEAARGLLTEIGVYLPIPKALAQPLAAAAKRQAGFLASNRPQAGTHTSGFDVDFTKPETYRRFAQPTRR